MGTLAIFYWGSASPKRQCRSFFEGFLETEQPTTIAHPYKGALFFVVARLPAQVACCNILLAGIYPHHR